MKWRVLKSGKMSSAENMAVDEAILNGIIAGKSMPTIRFYDWEVPTASCGYNQQADKEVDFNVLKDFGFGFVRRPTGGRLVLHDHEVTYAVISPIAGRLGGNVTEAYGEISRALAAGFHLLGVAVEFEKGNLSSSHQRQDANPCFTSSSRYELNYQGKKIVGSAQVRKEDALLQHGSILLNFDQSKVAHVLPGLEVNQRERLASILARKTVAINQLVDKEIAYDDAVNAFVKGFNDSWCDDQFVFCDDLNDFEKEQVQVLVETKYLTDEWNRRK